MTKRCSSSSVELKASHFPSGEREGRAAPFALLRISLGSLRTLSMSGSNRTVESRPVFSIWAYARRLPSRAKFRCAG